MKILQIIGTLNMAAGGPVEGLIQQGRALSERGCEVHTASLDLPGFVVDKRIASRSIFFLGPPKTKYAYSSHYKEWLQKNIDNYDVVVIHGMWQYIGLCASRVAIAHGVPYVIFLHGMLDPWFNREFPLKHLKKWLYWPWGEYRVLRDAAHVLFTSAEELKLARQSFPLYKVREKLVGYGIDGRRADTLNKSDQFLKEFPVLRGKRILLFLSRLHPKKGCDLLIDAFSKIAMRDRKLVLVMAGPDSIGWRAELEARCAALGISDQVFFPGMLEGVLKWGAFDSSEVFILPSHQENFGIAIAEALSSSLPALTTNKVNIWQEIEAGGGGFIDEDDAEGIGRLLEKWMNMSDEQKDRMNSAALKCFLENFEINLVANNLFAALKSAATDVETAYTYVGKWSRT